MKEIKRIIYIDYAKAFAIFLVVLGHTGGLNTTLRNVVYSFHLPLFFILSGMVFNEKKYEINYMDFIVRKIKTLLIPYLKYSIYILVFYFFVYMYLKELDFKFFFHKFLGIFTCIRYTEYSGFLWFIISLFTIQIIIIILNKILKKNKTVLLVSLILSSALICVINGTKINLPLYFDLSLANLFFFSFGNYLRENNFLDKINTLCIFCIFFLAVTFNLKYCTYEIDIYFNEFGNVILFLIAAISGSIFFIKLFILLERIKKINFLILVGQNTNIIYCLHQVIVLPIVKKICTYLHIYNIFKDLPLLFSVIVTVISITLIIYYSLLKKIFSKQENKLLRRLSTLM
ncbi:MAG: acyltransferase family protein [Thomasclavelia spiroformis]